MRTQEVISCWRFSFGLVLGLFFGFQRFARNLLDLAKKDRLFEGALLQWITYFRHYSHYWKLSPNTNTAEHMGLSLSCFLNISAIFSFNHAQLHIMVIMLRTFYLFTLWLWVFSPHADRAFICGYAHPKPSAHQHFHSLCTNCLSSIVSSTGRFH